MLPFKTFYRYLFIFWAHVYSSLHLFFTFLFTSYLPGLITVVNSVLFSAIFSTLLVLESRKAIHAYSFLCWCMTASNIHFSTITVSWYELKIFSFFHCSTLVKVICFLCDCWNSTISGRGTPLVEISDWHSTLFQCQ